MSAEFIVPRRAGGRPEHEGNALFLAKAASWLIKKQNSDGGWSEVPDPSSPSSPSSIDNTFNVLRSLRSLRRQQIDVEGLERSIDRAQKFCRDVSPGDHDPISAFAFLLRARLLDAAGPTSKTVMDAVDAIVSRKKQWYDYRAHYYNEVLIVGLALGEWRHALEAAGQKLFTLDYAGRPALESFLCEFPTEAPTFYSRQSSSSIDRWLSSLSRTRFHWVVPWLEDVLNVKDLAGITLAFLFLLGFYMDSDVIRAVTLLNAGSIPWPTIPFVAAYLAWLLVKIRSHKRHWTNIAVTSLMSFAIAGGLVYWIGQANPEFRPLLDLQDHWGEALRLFLFFDLLLDVGKNIVDLAKIDEVFFPRK